MKDAEEEAFDDLAKRQGDWGSGFQAKRAAAMDKINADFDEEYIKYRDAFPKGYTVPQSAQEPPSEWASIKAILDEYGLQAIDFVADFKAAVAQPAHCQCIACKDGILHASDCAVHTGPAYSLGPCDCGVEKESDALTIAYQSGYYDGKKAALATREWNFCERCGKRTKDMFTIHTCTPPQEKNT